MKMIKCLKGHIYNADKFNVCPQCAGMNRTELYMEREVTGQDEIDTEEPDIVKQQKYEIVGRRKVVGCLICVKGSMTGAGFFLVEGHNDIGRGANLEVVLSKELTVSRKAHACITYDRESNRYQLVAAEGKKDVVYNGSVVEEAVILQNGGTICIGRCEMRFVAFCDDNFIWKD